jgi:shikimate kinase
MRLARRLHWDWLDADNELERRHGRTIKEIFATDGEPTFRRLEREVLADLLSRQRLVLSTGGGCVLNAETRRDLIAAGPVVWLRASVETIASRILHDKTNKARRPDLTAMGGIDEIRTLLTQREPLYRECATITIDTEGFTLAEAVSQVFSQLPTELTSEARS